MSWSSGIGGGDIARSRAEDRANRRDHRLELRKELERANVFSPGPRQELRRDRPDLTNHHVGRRRRRGRRRRGPLRHRGTVRVHSRRPANEASGRCRWLRRLFLRGGCYWAHSELADARHQIPNASDLLPDLGMSGHRCAPREKACVRRPVAVVREARDAHSLLHETIRAAQLRTDERDLVKRSLDAVCKWTCTFIGSTPRRGDDVRVERPSLRLLEADLSLEAVVRRNYEESSVW
ncbi:MAG: hypothetical protein HC923_08335 [Myxococcales bacterium]|nr:hypothetical protein [Myxococcales bacterium]